MDIADMLKDKKDVIKFLLKTIETNSKMTQGLRGLKTSQNEHFKTEKLLEVVANQGEQIKHMSLLLLCYSQGCNFDSDIAIMMNKMGRGEEALKQMFKNKMDGR
jgi:hypothetical protein